MAGRKPRQQTPATTASLSTSTEDRIQRLVIRVLRNSYGAESALRAAVRVGTREMLEAGASRSAVRHAVAQCLVSHPSSLPDKPSLMTGESRSSLLLTRMLGWTDDLMPAPMLAVGAP
jgi:hypothetical protein